MKLTTSIKNGLGKSEYAFSVMICNLGSQTVVHVDHIPGDEIAVMFKAIFITFSAMIKGLLKSCWSIIGMNRCHLKTTAGGCLLSAGVRDANNQMFPIGYAVVRV